MLLYAVVSALPHAALITQNVAWEKGWDLKLKFWPVKSIRLDLECGNECKRGLRLIIWSVN
jgi:hypothetical protein